MNTTCKWPECERESYARGFCTMHYARASRLGGVWDAPWTVWDSRDSRQARDRQTICVRLNCGRKNYGHGLCKKHHSEERYQEHFERETRCIWPDCDRPDLSRSFCVKHLDRARKVDNFTDPWVKWESERPYFGKYTHCRWPECGYDKVVGRGLCGKHYARSRKLGVWGAPWLVWKRRHGIYTNKVCRWPDCEREPYIHGLCTLHRSRANTLNDWDAPWVAWGAKEKLKAEAREAECRWPDCDRLVERKGFCNRHLQRAERLDDLDEPWLLWTTPEGTGMCAYCGDKIEHTSNPGARYCSKRCNARQWRIDNPEEWRAITRLAGQRRRARKLATTTEHFTEADVRDRFTDDCYLCTRQIDFTLPFPDPLSASLDHIIPLSKGGPHILENCAFVHFHCNNSKHNNLTDLRPTLLVK